MVLLLCRWALRIFRALRALRVFRTLRPVIVRWWWVPVAALAVFGLGWGARACSSADRQDVAIEAAELRTSNAFLGAVAANHRTAAAAAGLRIADLEAELEAQQTREPIPALIVIPPGEIKITVSGNPLSGAFLPQIQNQNASLRRLLAASQTRETLLERLVMEFRVQVGALEAAADIETGRADTAFRAAERFAAVPERDLFVIGGGYVMAGKARGWGAFVGVNLRPLLARIF